MLSGVVRSTVLRPLPAAVLLVVLTGCIKIDLALDINENEAIDGEIILALSKELAQLTGQSREQLIAQFEADVMRDAPEGVTKESYRTEGLEGTRLILHDVPVDAFDPIEEALSIMHEAITTSSTEYSIWLPSATSASCRTVTRRPSRASRTRWTCGLQSHFRARSSTATANLTARRSRGFPRASKPSRSMHAPKTQPGKAPRTQPVIDRWLDRSLPRCSS